jgi:hypothetical protein
MTAAQAREPPCLDTQKFERVGGAPHRVGILRQRSRYY